MKKRNNVNSVFTSSHRKHNPTLAIQHEGATVQSVENSGNVLTVIKVAGFVLGVLAFIGAIAYNVAAHGL